jgi:hypothetical protein
MHPDNVTAEQAATMQVATLGLDLKRKELRCWEHETANARTNRVMYFSEIFRRVHPESLKE